MKPLAVTVTSMVALVMAAGLAMSKAPSSSQPELLKPQVHTVKPHAKAENEIQGLLISAVPGDVIQLEAGTYEFVQEVISTQNNITIRGRGSDKTILSFKNQNAGSKGIEATGDAFVIEDLAVEDTIGNAIKVLGANGVTFRGVRTEWTGGPKASNGAYGLYPVQCQNVLIEDCVAIGASDAGIYVGQSKNIIVRRSRAEFNVAGIEIENSINSDVYENVATNNTGGLLIFDLPGLEVSNGSQCRVFDNKIFKNNHPNFAPVGNIVASVPPGTGITVMAFDDVEIFNNEITDNDTFSVGVYSYYLTGLPVKDENYSPFCSRISIHDNVITGGGKNPGGSRKDWLQAVVGDQVAQVFYDGAVNPGSLVDGKFPKEEGLLLWNNGENVDIVNINLLEMENGDPANARVDRDISHYTGKSEPLAAVQLDDHPKIDTNDAQLVALYRAAPEKLSEYGLFKGNGSTQEPAEGVIPYDMNTELFADYATKHRFVRVPEGASAKYTEDGEFEFPIGTLLVKTFGFLHDMTDPSQGETLIETRVIKHEPSGWYGFTYVWNEDQTDATLSLGGGTDDLSWIDSHGNDRTNNYIIPNANQCKSCHVVGDKFRPLGPKARNLNRDYDYSDGTHNQLAYWSHAGILSDAASPEVAPRAAQSDDPSTGSVDERSRAWLDVNCAHCHSATGAARTSGLDLSYHQQDATKLGIMKSPVAAGRGSGGRKFGIVPGKPDESILLYRLDSTEPGVMMPELPRRLIDEEGVALIREWIEQMPPNHPTIRTGGE